MTDDIFDPEHPMNVQLREMHARIQTLPWGSGERAALAIDIGWHIDSIRGELPQAPAPVPKGFLAHPDDPTTMVDGRGDHYERPTHDYKPAKGAFPRWIRDCAPFGNNATYMYLRAAYGNDRGETASLTMASKGWHARRWHAMRQAYKAMTPEERAAYDAESKQREVEALAALRALGLGRPA